MADRNDASHFERDVRHVANVLWRDQFGGAENISGRERDGIYETRDAIHLVEATTSRRKDYVDEKSKAMSQALQKLRGSVNKHCQGWLVTREDPTADQRDAVRKYLHSVRLVGFQQFRSLLFNGTEYLTCREAYAFGSVRDYESGTVHLPIGEFIPANFLSEGRERTVRWDEYQGLVGKAGARICIVGEYGAGKSMSLRATFSHLAKRYRSQQSSNVPIYINLRDHNGQSDPVEALERHSRRIGYSSAPTDVVRAWRAGCVDLILDGFDELATAGWGGSLQKVRAHREVGMRLVSKFISESPSSIGIYLAGRENFFDNFAEMKRALGLLSQFTILRTADFDEDQLARYLKRHGVSAEYPSWMPTRPLLVAYLIAQGLVGQGESNVSPAVGWDRLLEMISDREAEQDARLDGETARNILERLATTARGSIDGRGHFDITTIQRVFHEIAGFPPDEQSQQFIMRLPGLGPTSAEDGSRAFYDVVIAQAASAGDPWRYISNPYSAHPWLGDVSAPLSELAIEIVVDRLFSTNATSNKTVAAASHASTLKYHQTTADLLAVCCQCEAPTKPVDGFVVGEGTFERLEFADHARQGWLSGVTLSDCLIGALIIEEEYSREHLPRLRNCLIGTLEGVFGQPDMPPVFSGTEVEEFGSSASRNASILALDIPPSARVLLTVLHKLFAQSGAGRLEDAFYRGPLGSKEKKLVPEVLALVRRLDFAHPSKLRGNSVWHPTRSKAARALSILAAPTSSSDTLYLEALEL